MQTGETGAGECSRGVVDTVCGTGDWKLSYLSPLDFNACLALLAPPLVTYLTGDVTNDRDAVCSAEPWDS